MDVEEGGYGTGYRSCDLLPLVFCCGECCNGPVPGLSDLILVVGMEVPEGKPVLDCGDSRGYCWVLMWLKGELDGCGGVVC